MKMIALPGNENNVFTVNNFRSQSSFTVEIERRRPPHVHIVYNHATKSGAPVNTHELALPSKVSAFEKAVRFAKQGFIFERKEIDALYKNEKVRAQFEEFKKTNPVCSFTWFVNKQPFTI